MRIGVFRAGGPGGQSVNTTDSAVRITTYPLVFLFLNKIRNLNKNKAKGMKILRPNLVKSAIEKEDQKIEKVSGTGDRSEE